MARQEMPPQANPDGSVRCGHVIVTTCNNCGFDLPEQAMPPKCPQCKEPLSETFRQDATIAVTSLPPIFGEANIKGNPHGSQKAPNKAGG